MRFPATAGSQRLNWKTYRGEHRGCRLWRVRSRPGQRDAQAPERVHQVPEVRQGCSRNL